MQNTVFCVGLCLLLANAGIFIIKLFIKGVVAGIKRFLCGNENFLSLNYHSKHGG